MMAEHPILDAASLGALIRRRRKELGLRQPDLALTCNVGVRFIVDLERGKPTCQIGKVLTILQGLGIQFIGRYEPMTPYRQPPEGSLLLDDVDDEPFDGDGAA